jgi:hypothetical protein
MGVQISTQLLICVSKYTCEASALENLRSSDWQVIAGDSQIFSGTANTTEYHNQKRWQPMLVLQNIGWQSFDNLNWSKDFQKSTPYRIIARKKEFTSTQGSFAFSPPFFNPTVALYITDIAQLVVLDIWIL